MTETIPPESEHLERFICCDGIVTIKAIFPTPMQLNWTHEETNNGGSIDISGAQLPISWSVVRQSGRAKYFVDVVTTYRDLTEIVTQVAQFCGPFIGFAITGKPNNQDEPAQTIRTTSWTYATNWDYLRGDNIITIQIVKPDETFAYANVQAGGGRSNIPLKTEIRLETLRSQISGECVNQDSCTLMVKDGNGLIFFTKSFNNSCPVVSLSGCEYLEENMRIRKLRLKSYYDFDPVINVRTQSIDCLEIFSFETPSYRKGLNLYKVTYWETMLIKETAGKRDIEFDQWEERELYAQLLSPVGCDYPWIDITCDGDSLDEEEKPPEETECPPGTAYECIRTIDSIRFKCCYDCEGNVIQTIRLGAV